MCPALAMLEPLVELPAPEGQTAAHDPLLQSLGQGEVLALVRREAPPSPGPEVSSVVEIRLSPWETWPPKVQPPQLVHGDSWDIPFVSSVEPSGTFALGLAPFPKNNPSGCDLAAIYGLSPDAPPGPSAVALSFDGSCNDAPLSVATAGDGSHFVANEVLVLPGNKESPPVRGLAAHVLDASGNKINSLELICASPHFVGNVLSKQTGFLFVHSSSDSQSCSEPGPVGPARNLLLRRLDGTENKTSILYKGIDDLVYTRLLPRKGGAWVLYRESGASAVAQPPGMALRLEGDSPSGEAFPVTSQDTDRMAAAALGDGFVVAFVDTTDPSAPQILVSVYDGTGTLVSQASIGTNGAWLHGDRLTLVASPSATSFLVGWIGAKAASGSEMFLRRFDCVAHE